MATNNKEISDIVKKSKILLLDIEGTTTSISFVKDKLFPYAENNVKQFLDSQWETENVKVAVTALRKLALEDQEKSVDGVIAIPGEDASKEDQIEGLVKNFKWQMSSDRKVGALKQLQGMIWKQGYDKGDIKGHVYDDVLPALEQWHAADGQQVYIYSSGSVEAQKLLFGQSVAGDLLKFIDGHFDTAEGGKQEVVSYKAIIAKIGCNADEVLFLTDIVEEAEAAHQAGLKVALVSRQGNAPFSEEAIIKYPVIQTFAQLTISNKRKTDPQDEQPAKVPKTENNDVKASESVSETTQVETEKPKEETEKMEIDDAVAEAVESKEKIETAIEKVTDMKKVDATICDIKPIISEANVEKSGATKAEVMETDALNGKHELKTKVDEIVTEKPESKDEKAPMETEDVPKDQTEVKKDTGPVAEETPPTIITEIKEVTNDKESLSEVAQIINELEPVVEEPADMEDLQNVGEELEKECNEILSKVQDVTNLDNITAKPTLNPIIEEAMEAENGVDKVNDEVKPADATNGEKAKDAVHEVTTKDEKSESSKVSNETTSQKKDNKDKAEAAPDTKADETKETEKLKLDAKENDSMEEKTSDKVSEPVKVSENTTDKKTDSNETSVEKKPEVQLNGDAKNGTPEPVTLNGVEKEDEISARLSAENGKLNGSNGDSNDAEKTADSKIEEIAEIKTKTLAAEEPRPDPLEQAAKA